SVPPHAAQCDRRNRHLLSRFPSLHEHEQGRLTTVSGLLVAVRMGVPDLVLAELMSYKTQAYKRVLELGLEPGKAVDNAVLEGKVYQHLDAVCYQLGLLQTLVCSTSHAITQQQVHRCHVGSAERIGESPRSVEQGLPQQDALLIMIVENLFDRYVRNIEGVAGSG
ncbi:unnamed protein product, partial [Ascophyllum nodosum]